MDLSRTETEIFCSCCIKSISAKKCKYKRLMLQMQKKSSQFSKKSLKEIINNSERNQQKLWKKFSKKCKYERLMLRVVLKCKMKEKFTIASLCQSFDEISQVFPLKWEKLDLASMLQRYLRCTQIYICFFFIQVFFSFIHSNMYF